MGASQTPKSGTRMCGDPFLYNGLRSVHTRRSTAMMLSYFFLSRHYNDNSAMDAFNNRIVVAPAKTYSLDPPRVAGIFGPVTPLFESGRTYTGEEIRQKAQVMAEQVLKISGDRLLAAYLANHLVHHRSSK